MAAAVAVAPTIDMADELSDQEEEEEVRMMEHNQRFQAAVMRSMEKQVGHMEEQLFDKDFELLNNERARGDLSMWAGRMKKDVQQLEALKLEQKEQITALTTGKQVAQTERDSYKRQLEKEQSEKEQLNKANNALTSKLSDTEDKLHKALTLCKTWNDQVSMHRMIETNFETRFKEKKKELAEAQEKSEYWRKQLEKSDMKVVQTEASRDAQEQETKKAIHSVNVLVDELKLMQQTSDGYKSQLFEAAQLMTKRDSLLYDISEKKEEYAHNAHLLAITERRLTQKNRELEQKNAQEKAHNERQMDEADNLNTALGEKIRELNETEHNLEMMGIELVRTRCELDDMTSKYERLNHKHTVQTTKHNALKASFATLKQDHTEFQFESEKMSSIQKEEILKMKVAWEEGMRQAKMAYTNLSNVKARQGRAKVEIEIEHDKMLKRHEILDKDFGHLISSYDRMSQENTQLRAELETQRYRANKYASELKQSSAQSSLLLSQKQQVLKLEIAKLEKHIEERKKDILALSASYVKQEQMFKKETNLRQQTEHKNDGLKSELEIESAIKVRMKDEGLKLKKDFEQANTDLNLTRCELARVVRRNEKLQGEIKALKARAINQKFDHEEVHESYKAEVGTLKTKLVQSRQNHARDEKLLQIQETERARMVLERKLVYLNDKLEKREVELEENTKIRFEMQHKMMKMEKDHASTEKQYKEWRRSFENAMQKGFAQRQQRNNLHTGLLSSTSPATSRAQGSGSPRKQRLLSQRMNGAQSARGSNTNFADDLVHNLRSQLNRANTLAAERLNELVKVKQRLTDLRREREMEKKKSDSNILNQSNWQQERMKLLEQMRSIQQKYLRLESISASLEQQINQSVDYKYYPDLEPSLKLRNAIESNSIGQGHRLGGGGRRGRRKANPVTGAPIDSVDDFMRTSGAF